MKKKLFWSTKISLAKDLRRVMVFGPTGSGKTTFANNLGKILGSKAIHLDDIFWGPNWEELNTVDFKNEVFSEMSDGNWIIDGNYSRIRSYILPKATFVVFLCMPKPVLYWRIFVRTLARNSQFKIHEPTLLPLKVLKDCGKENYLILSRPEDVKRLLSKIKKDGNQVQP